MEHTRDEDCVRIDPATDTCLDCGVLHGEPCDFCGESAFHLDGCPVITFCIACEHDAADHGADYGPVGDPDPFEQPCELCACVAFRGAA